jgi:hypothetical protein
MRTDFAAGLNTELAKVITSPVYLVEMNFATPVRYSSMSQVTYLTFTWLAADMDVRMSDSPTLSILNESLSLGTTILSEGTAGKTVKIYSYYNTHGTLLFSGEMGGAVIGERVSIVCKPRPPNLSPRFYAMPPHCNFVPKTGTRITVAKGTVIVLEGR